MLRHRLNQECIEKFIKGKLVRITLISRSWPPDERSGVSLSAYGHARILLEQGHEVSIIGSTGDVGAITLPVSSKTHIRATGSGALYSPTWVDKRLLEAVLKKNAPDLVVLEAWQTAVTDCAIEVAHAMHIPILMISHGISIWPYQKSVMQLMRSLAWLPYRFFKLPRLMKKLSAITALDVKSNSNRFVDRNLAMKLGIPVSVLRNFPAHHAEIENARANRKLQILVVGYFSAVKNQLDAIYVLSCLPDNVDCCFIGDRQGKYFDACQKLVRKLKLEKRVRFLQDNECEIAQKMSESLVVFAPSITEVLPLTLIESMASGTPFVATPVGAVEGFYGGILASNMNDQVKAIQLLIDDPSVWENYSVAGKRQYQTEFTGQKIATQLASAVSLAMNCGVTRP